VRFGERAHTCGSPATSKNPFALNPHFNQQTRKLLGKHYRAKFGVK
jgi:hypothetical protein